MSGVWRIVAAAVFAALASGVMPGQIAPVQLTIEPARLIRGRTAILDISLQIQEGYFVPAQTRGSLKGAWVQALPPWLSRTLPTYPIPNSVRLPASDTAVLAYSGKVIIRLPVEVPAGVQGLNELGIRFGYQLCDSRSCGAFVTVGCQGQLQCGGTATESGSACLSPRLTARCDRNADVATLKHRADRCYSSSGAIHPASGDPAGPSRSAVPVREGFPVRCSMDDSLEEQPVQCDCGTAGDCIVAMRRRPGASCRRSTCYR